MAKVVARPNHNGHQRVSTRKTRDVRKPAEIQARIAALKEEIQGHDVWIDGAWGKIPEPDSRRKKEIFKGKLLELEWVLGRDVDLTTGT